MKYLFFLLFCFYSINNVVAQAKEEKINVSYWYVLGRFPSTAELNYWKSQNEQSLTWYINNHHNYLKGDDASNTEAVRLSYKDAFGRAPSQVELDFWKKQKRSYADLMNNHVMYLLSDGNENKATINRAYQAVFNRAASSEEMNQWSKSNFSYLLLTNCLQSYKTSGYRLQSAEGVFNFLKSAWETSTNFVVNTGSAIYKTTVNAVTATVAAAQRVLSLGMSKQVTDEIQRFDSKVVSRSENGNTVLIGGASAMKDISRLINLDGGTVVGTNGATLIAAGGLN